MFKNYMFESKKDLRGIIRDLKKEKVILEEKDLDHEVKLSTIELDHREEIKSIEGNFSYDVLVLENKIQGLTDSLALSIKREVASTKKEYEVKTEKLEKEHKDAMKTAKGDLAKNIESSDKKLEEDKTSYRKYLKKEHNTENDRLVTGNKKLFADNAKLDGENKGLISRATEAETQVKTLTTLVSKFVEALPKVSAEITTPVVNVQVPSVGNKDNKDGK